MTILERGPSAKVYEALPALTILLSQCITLISQESSAMHHRHSIAFGIRKTNFVELETYTDD